MNCYNFSTFTSIFLYGFDLNALTIFVSIGQRFFKIPNSFIIFDLFKKTTFHTINIQ